ncbi:MAG: putative photosynthetic complex assembly protein PuhE [Pseudomonadota bacterium]
MLERLAPVAIAVLVWWSSTGLLIWLVRRGSIVRRNAAMVLIIAAIGATFCIIPVRNEASSAGAYSGFAIGLTVWAWHEAMFLFGFVTGPTRTSSPVGLKGWSRFWASTQVVLYHELAIAAHGALIIWLSAGYANTAAAMTFVLLWGMRLSAKLLIFMGAKNASDAFLPEHLKYLASYFNTARTTPFFPLFLASTGLVAIWLLQQGTTAPPGTFEAVSFLLIGTLALLAAFEHLALILPLQDQRLWAWALRKNTSAEQQKQNDKLDYGRT